MRFEGVRNINIWVKETFTVRGQTIIHASVISLRCRCLRSVVNRVIGTTRNDRPAVKLITNRLIYIILSPFLSTRIQIYTNTCTNIIHIKLLTQKPYNEWKSQTTHGAANHQSRDGKLLRESKFIRRRRRRKRLEKAWRGEWHRDGNGAAPINLSRFVSSTIEPEPVSVLSPGPRRNWI